MTNTVRSAKERAKAWSEAVIATHAALEAMRKLVTDGATNPEADREVSSDGPPMKYWEVVADKLQHVPPRQEFSPFDARVRVGPLKPGL